MIHGQPMKKRQAEELGIQFYHSGKPCVNGHWAYRRTNGGWCIACERNQKQRRKRDRAKHLLQQKKAQCKHYGIEFNLKSVLIPEKCPALGIALDWGCSHAKPTLDRVDPQRGYVEGNVQVISARANRIKNNATANELRRIADYIEENR